MVRDWTAKGTCGAIVVVLLCIAEWSEGQNLTVAGLETRVLAAAPGRWFGRAVMERLDDGTIVLCYREAKMHVASEGIVHICFSSNGGKDWSAPDCWLDGSEVAGFPVEFGKDDAFEPYLYVAPDGRVILHVWRTSGRDFSRGKGTWQTASSDNGRTWGTFAQVDFEGIANDDRCYANDDHTVVGDVIYTSLREFVGGAQGWQCRFIQSVDNGETWRQVTAHINRPEHNSVEKGFEYVGGKRIVCVGSEGHGRRMVLLTSTDDLGATWRPWKDILPDTGVWDRPRIWTLAHLKGEDEWWNDPTLIGVGNTTPQAGTKVPRANAVYLSMDRGATWSMLGGKPIDTFHKDGGYGDLVYDHDTETFVYVSYRGGFEGGAEIVQYRFQLRKDAPDRADARDDER